MDFIWNLWTIKQIQCIKSVAKFNKLGDVKNPKFAQAHFNQQRFI